MTKSSLKTVALGQLGARVPDLPGATTEETMSSLEMVDLVNHSRAEVAKRAGKTFPSRGHAKLQHADFLRKVPEVLGVCARNFSGTYDVPGPNGGTRPENCYNFPKRESHLMAMSYSYEMQARVYDRWQELEEKSTRQLQQQVSAFNQARLEHVSAPGYHEMRKLDRKEAQKDLLKVAVKRFRTAVSNDSDDRRHLLELGYIDLTQDEIHQAMLEFYVVNAAKLLDLEEKEALGILRHGRALAKQ